MSDYISDDIFRDIFSRLPVKSILRFKCLSKPCFTLFSTPLFIKLHSERSSLKNPNLLVKTRTPSNASYVLQTLDTSLLKELCPIHLMNLPPFNQITVVGSCNGLVCLWNYKNRLSILNPSTREHVDVPPDSNSDGPLRCLVMGFGFDPIRKEYKLVRIAGRSEFPEFKTMVYTLGKSSSWRVVENLSQSIYSIQCEPGIHLNGVLYWEGLLSLGYISLFKYILSFDLRTEMYGKLQWPHTDGDGVDMIITTLGVWQGSLATYCNYLHYDRVEIWILVDGEAESWVNVFSFSQPLCFASCIKPVVLRNEGDILLQIGENEMILYDPVDNRDKYLSILFGPYVSVKCTYVEALTSISSLMADVVEHYKKKEAKKGTK